MKKKKERSELEKLLHPEILIHVLPGGSIPERQTEGAIGYDAHARAIVSPFNMDPELNKPYGVPSSGLPQKSVHTKDGTYSTSGSAFSTSGVSGLSRANKEFNLPTDKDKPIKFKKRIGEKQSEIDEYGVYEDPNDPRLPWEKSEPVGQAGPKFIGSRGYQNLKGFRRK